MKMPSASDAAVRLLESLTPKAVSVSTRLVFGQPAAFANGNMFLGVFGNDVFLRLSQVDLAEAQAIPGARPFEPMEGRPMRGYVVLPPKLLGDPKQGGPWVRRSLEFALTLPAKSGKRKAK